MAQPHKPVLVGHDFAIRILGYLALFPSRAISDDVLKVQFTFNERRGMGHELAWLEQEGWISRMQTSQKGMGIKKRTFDIRITQLGLEALLQAKNFNQGRKIAG